MRHRWIDPRLVAEYEESLTRSKPSNASSASKEVGLRESRIAHFRDGAAAGGLSPGLILSTAESDLRGKRENAQIRSIRAHNKRALEHNKVCEPGDEIEPTPVSGAVLHKYAFQAKHVRDARTPLELIEAACKWVEECGTSTPNDDTAQLLKDINTLRIYSSLEALQKARALAIQKAAEAGGD